MFRKHLYHLLTQNAYYRNLRSTISRKTFMAKNLWRCLSALTALQKYSYATKLPWDCKQSIRQVAERNHWWGDRSRDGANTLFPFFKNVQWERNFTVANKLANTLLEYDRSKPAKMLIGQKPKKAKKRLRLDKKDPDKELTYSTLSDDDCGCSGISALPEEHLLCDVPFLKGLNFLNSTRRQYTNFRSLQTPKFEYSKIMVKIPYRSQ